MSNFYLQAQSPQVITSGLGTQVNGGASPVLTTSLSLLIPANTIVTGDFIRIEGLFDRIAGGATTIADRVYINTSNTLVGATLLGNFGTLTTNQMHEIERRFFYDGTNLINCASANNSPSNYLSIARGAFAYNATLDYYWLFATLPVASSVSQCRKMIISKN